jgi:hypothetical protein
VAFISRVMAQRVPFIVAEFALPQSRRAWGTLLRRTILQAAARPLGAASSSRCLQALHNFMENPEPSRTRISPEICASPDAIR